MNPLDWPESGQVAALAGGVSLGLDHGADRQIRFPRKILVEDPKTWPHHRGGWRQAMADLTANFHHRDGTLFIAAIEDELKRRPITRPWVGFFHQVPRRGDTRFPDLQQTINSPAWHLSIRHCRGVWVMSDYVRHFLRMARIPVTIDLLHHPAAQVTKTFSYTSFTNQHARMLVSVGYNQRKLQSFAKLNLRNYTKLLLVPSPRYEADIRRQIGTGVDRISAHLPNERYDDLLSRSVVFLHFEDVSAANTIVECIASATPLIVNRHPAISEYLGTDYPFYSRSIEEAERKLADDTLIVKTHEYLLGLRQRAKIGREDFIVGFHGSRVYQSLPTIE